MTEASAATSPPPHRAAAEPRNLTAEEIERAISELPAHRDDVRQQALNTLALVRRGIPIKTNAPSWIQLQNVVFVSKIDVGEPEGGDDSDE